MTDRMKAGVYFFGMVNDLKNLGYIQGGPEPTDKGISEFDQLKASGFQPSLDDLYGYAMATFRSEESAQAMVQLAGSYIRGEFPEQK